MLLERGSSRFSDAEILASIPSSAKWGDTDFVMTLLGQVRPDTDKCISLETTLSILRSDKGPLFNLREPRHQFEWYENASCSLRSVAKACGYSSPKNVVHEHMSPTSTILKVNCENGSCYSKSPVAGTKEIEISHEISALYPQNAVDVLAISTALHSFVTRGYRNDRGTEKDAFRISMEMGNLQKSSLEHLEKLTSAGIETRGPLDISEALDLWVDDPFVKRSFSGMFKEFVSFLPRVKQTCAELLSYKVPLTLLHGDLMPHNTVLKDNEGGILFYDWEYCCISHPFCDFHEIHELLQPEEIREYPSLWVQFEPIERLEEAFHKARKVGLWLKIWTMLNCIRVADAQKNSFLEEFARDCFDWAKQQFST